MLFLYTKRVRVCVCVCVYGGVVLAVYKIWQVSLDFSILIALQLSRTFLYLQAVFTCSLYYMNTDKNKIINEIIHSRKEYTVLNSDCQQYLPPISKQTQQLPFTSNH